jgi:hypothetical protein
VCSHHLKLQGEHFETNGSQGLLVELCILQPGYYVQYNKKNHPYFEATEVGTRVNERLVQWKLIAELAELSEYIERKHVARVLRRLHIFPWGGCEGKHVYHHVSVGQISRTDRSIQLLHLYTQTETEKHNRYRLDVRSINKL